jgi:hypothetical protein
MATFDDMLADADYSLKAARSALDRRSKGSCKATWEALTEASRHITQAAARADSSNIRQVGKRIDKWHVLSEWFEEVCIGED